MADHFSPERYGLLFWERFSKTSVPSGIIQSEKLTLLSTATHRVAHESYDQYK